MIRIYPEKVECPYCGYVNSTIIRSHVDWFKKNLGFNLLLEGTLNTFKCEKCKKLGFSRERIKISLEHVQIYFIPIFPEENRRESKEEGVQVYYEPLGEPLILLKEFIQKYEEEMNELYKKDPKEKLRHDLLRGLD